MILDTATFKQDKQYPGWKVSEKFTVPESYITSDGVILGDCDEFRIATQATGTISATFQTVGGDRYYPETEVKDLSGSWESSAICSDWGDYLLTYDAVTGTVGYDGRYFIDPLNGVARGEVWFNHTEAGITTGSISFEWSGECRFTLDTPTLDSFTLEVFYPYDTLPCASYRLVGSYVTGSVIVPPKGTITISATEFSYLLESELGAGIYEVETDHTVEACVPTLTGSAITTGNIGKDFKLSLSSSGRIYPAIRFRRRTASIAFVNPDARIIMWPYDPLMFIGNVQYGTRLSQFLPSNFTKQDGSRYFKFTAATGVPMYSNSHIAKADMPEWVTSDDINKAVTIPEFSLETPQISMWTTSASIPTGQCQVDLGYTTMTLKEYSNRQLLYCPQPGYTFIKGKAYFINLDAIVSRGSGNKVRYAGMASAGEALSGTWLESSYRDPYCDTFARYPGLANLINHCSISGNPLLETASESYFKQCLDILGIKVKPRDDMQGRMKSFYLADDFHKISAALFDAKNSSSVDIGYKHYQPIPRYSYYHAYLTPVDGIFRLPFIPDHMEVYSHQVKVEVSLTGNIFAAPYTSLEVHLFGTNYWVTPAGKIEGMGVSYYGNNYILPRLDFKVLGTVQDLNWSQPLNAGLYVTRMDELD